MTVESQITIASILVDLNLAVRYGIGIRTYIWEEEILVDSNFVVEKEDCKFSGLG